MRAVTVSVALLFLLAAGGWTQTRRLVVGIGGILHESNSFNTAKTASPDFEVHTTDSHASGTDSLSSWRKGNTVVTGFLEGLAAEDVDAYPGFYASATPKGPLTKAAFDELTQRLVASLKAAPKLDGILLALHGAMLADGYPHADEEIVRRVRNAFGASIPIVITHDFHGNPSPGIVKLSTALVAYQQNPHLDTVPCGRRAANILARTLRGEINPVQVIVKPQMIYNIVFQNTYAKPLLPITRASMDLEKTNPKILAVSVMAGYQYADIDHMGPSIIVVADGDAGLARRGSAILRYAVGNPGSNRAESSRSCGSRAPGDNRYKVSCCLV